MTRQHMTYREKLQHPNWQRRRLERLSVSDFVCENCSAADKPLHVHHKRYVTGRMPWEYGDDELAVLCDRCHDIEHGRLPVAFGAVPATLRADRDAVRRGDHRRAQELTRQAAQMIAAEES